MFAGLNLFWGYLSTYKTSMANYLGFSIFLKLCVCLDDGSRDLVLG
jgi:hypothetical protein